MSTEWIVGRRSVQEALRAGRELEKLLVAEGVAKGSVAVLLKKARERGIPVQYVPRNRLDRLTAGANHQGVVAEAAAYRYARLEDLFRRAEERGESPFFILLDGIEDPHNLGSILRTADAAGAHGVIIPKRRAVGLTYAVGKASAGAVEHIPVVRVTNLPRTAGELKEAGLWIIGSSPEGESDYTEADYTMPLGLVIGSEGRGMSRLMKETCDLLVRLPMAGRVASLNASVAAALLMYEVLRRRRRQGDY
jgi:23S rRNA (guanosine2251-2'-O)-methyltransferase